MKSDFVDLGGHVALVTGASRGIGRTVAVALASAGASVAINYRESASAAEEVAAAVRAAGRRAVAVQADVSRGAEVARMMNRIEAELGTVDILVNNAGIAIPRGIDDVDESAFDQTIAVNLKSAFLCIQAALPGMRARRWGRIVNMSSVAARGGGAIGVHYNASKAGLEGLTRGYAARLAAEGITVNAIAPGPTETDMALSLPRDVASRIPVRRLGTPEEVAQAVLLAAANGFMTGQVVHVNGGLLFA
ncbi:MAG TPA: SDR family NAD(P)-dependent oxidoreductase [Burkholderiaceae bacterium]|nr:SDR family NAD(P)-dependent oxidoreductase [Burkholderiaceae bacterium]